MTPAEQERIEKRPPQKGSVLGRRSLVVLFTFAVITAAVYYVGVDDIVEVFPKFSVETIILIFALFVLNLIVVTFRLGRVLSTFGLHLGVGPISRASISGHLAAFFAISLFGQVVGRHAALKRYGVSSMAIASVTVYERIVLMAVSGLLGFFGALYLVKETVVFGFLESIPVAEAAIFSTLALGATLSIGRSKLDRGILSNVFDLSNLKGAIEIVLITLVAQGLVLVSFSVGALTINPGMDVTSVIAAAAIVSFAASMPITVNGWGVREVAAMYAFGQLGMPFSSSIALSILIGLCSTLVVVVMAPLMLRGDKIWQISNSSMKSESELRAPLKQGNSIEQYMSYILMLVTAIAIFFQLHANIYAGSLDVVITDPLAATISINFADPLAIIGFAALVAHAVSCRELPKWQVPHFSLILIALGGLMLFAFLRGASDFGVTQWALTSRLLGWLVILGYVSIGFLLIEFNGRQLARRFVETLVVTSTIIVIFKISVRVLASAGYEPWGNINFNFDGYTGNRNAFAFQLLVCIALLMGYSKVYSRCACRSIVKGTNSLHKVAGRLSGEYLAIIRSKYVWVSVALAVLAVGLIFTGSRTGLFAGIGVGILAWVTKLANRRFLEVSAVFGVIVWMIPIFALQLLLLDWRGGVTEIDWSTINIVQAKFSGGTSQVERMAAISKGLEFWLESPLLGKGLGYFLHHSIEYFPKPLLIHNTSVWLLAEFGLLGLLSIVFSFLFVFVVIAKKRTLDGASRGILLVLLTAAIFSAAHEIFYQRIFWLALGVCVAGTYSLDRYRKVGNSVICHIITGLNAGGAERMLTRLMSTKHKRNMRQVVISLMGEGVFGREIREQGVQLYTLNMNRGYPSPSSVFKLLKVILKEKPDLVITWLYHSDLLGTIASWILGVRRLIWNIRCSDMTPSSKRLSTRAMMWFLIRVSGMPEKVLVNSEAGRRHHSALGYNPKEWRVISNGVDVQKFRPDTEARHALRESLAIPDDALVVGHIARFDPMKDYDTLLASLKTTAQEIPDLHMVLVGKGVSRENPFFAEALKKFGLDKRAYLLGSRTDIPDVLAGFDLLIQSSAYGEGAPNVIIEAMACAVPCVVTDVGDSNYIVGDTGRVVPPRQPELLAREVIGVLALDHENKKRLGEMARARVVLHFNIDHVTDTYDEIAMEEVWKLRR